MSDRGHSVTVFSSQQNPKRGKTQSGREPPPEKRLSEIIGRVTRNREPETSPESHDDSEHGSLRDSVPEDQDRRPPGAPSVRGSPETPRHRQPLRGGLAVGRGRVPHDGPGRGVLTRILSRIPSTHPLQPRHQAEPPLPQRGRSQTPRPARSRVGRHSPPDAGTTPARVRAVVSSTRSMNSTMSLQLTGR